MEDCSKAVNGIHIASINDIIIIIIAMDIKIIITVITILLSL